MLKNIDYGELTLAGLSEVYISLHIFDLEEDVYYPVKTNKYIEMWAEGFDNSREQLHNVMTMITAEEHLNLILEFTDLTTLEERMKDQKVISAVFHGKVNGWCRARFIKVTDSDNEKLRYVLYAVECIDEEKKKENHLLYLSQTDLMTGIFNRGYGERMISELLDMQRQGLFCLFDVDKFKNINDRYGHSVGDKVLIEISKALQKVKRSNDIVMRLGGDEFAAYFVDIDCEPAALEIMAAFFSELLKIHIEPISEKISVSLGAVLYKEGFSFDSIYKLADKGVYDSKTNKGNSYTFFN